MSDTPSVRPTPKPRRWWRGMIVGLVVAVLAWAGWHLERTWRLHEGLPAAPGKIHPAALADALSIADQQARGWRSAEAGLIELGRLYHANAFDAEAAACWSLLHQREPRNARWPYLLADLRSRQGDAADLAVLLTQTVALAPDYAPAWLRLGDLELKRGRFPAALQAYERRIALMPGDPYARLGLVRLATQAGASEESRRLLEGLLADHPRFATAHNLYAELLAAEGHDDDARRHRWLGREAGRFRAAEDPWLSELNAYCYDPSTLRLFGVIDFQTGQGDRGLAALQRAMQLSPHDASLAETLGDLYLKLKQPAKAREVLEQGLALPGPPTASPTHYVTLALAHYDLGQSDAAVATLRRGLARHPRAFEVHSKLGRILADLGRGEESLAAYRQAVALNPQDAESNFGLGLALLQRDEMADGVAAIKQALASQPTFPNALKVLAQLALDSPEPRTALPYLQLLQEAHPGDPQVQELMAEWQAIERRAGRP